MNKRRQDEAELSEFWRQIKEQALDRRDTDCPICFNQFVNYKKTALLDCSHMFHS